MAKRSKDDAAGKGRTKLEGSCQCGKVEFTVESETPVPFMFCFCSICRKTGGSAFGCNIMGIRDTLTVKGQQHLRAYHARIREPGKRTRISEAQRWFCAECGTHLYLTDEQWPKGIWPYAAAIDTPLPEPEHPVAIMTRWKASWVPAWMLEHEEQFAEYPDVSIATWHEHEGWPVTVTP
jgi:hypothetical protein